MCGSFLLIDYLLPKFDALGGLHLPGATIDPGVFEQTALLLALLSNASNLLKTFGHCRQK